MGRLPAGRVVQSCSAGRLDVEVSAEGARLAGGPPHPGAPLDPAPLLAAVGLERVLFHLLQEYARHLGHLDVVAELGGGPVGE